MAQREQAENEFRRFTALVEQNAATRQEFDAVQARQRVAHAAVIEAETLIGSARLSAPFDGVVTRKAVEVGDLAVPGKTLLEIEDPTSLRLEADVGEGLISLVELGQSLDVRVSVLAAPPQGVISEIAPTADPVSRTFVVKLHLPPRQGFAPACSARLGFPLGNEPLRACQHKE